MEPGMSEVPKEYVTPRVITETNTDIDNEIAKFTESYEEMTDPEKEQLKKEMINFIQSRGKDTTSLSSANQIINTYIRLKNEINPGLPN